MGGEGSYGRRLGVGELKFEVEDLFGVATDGLCHDLEEEAAVPRCRPLCARGVPRGVATAEPTRALKSKEFVQKKEGEEGCTQKRESTPRIERVTETKVGCRRFMTRIDTNGQVKTIVVVKCGHPPPPPPREVAAGGWAARRVPP